MSFTLSFLVRLLEIEARDGFDILSTLKNLLQAIFYLDPC